MLIKPTMAKGLFDSLHEANLGQYIPQFRLHGVTTLGGLASLTLQDYDRFGITSAEDRKRLFQLILIVKGVKEEKRMSFTMGTESTQDKENTPLEINVSSSNNSLKEIGDRSRSKKTTTDVGSLKSGNVSYKEVGNVSGRVTSLKDIDKDGSVPSSLSIQWSQRKRDNSAHVATTKQIENMHCTNIAGKLPPNVLPISGSNDIKPETLRRLEDQGGILFIQTSPCLKHKISSRNRNHHLRQSLSDTEATDDFTNANTAPVDATGFGAPKLKTSCVKVIDHKETGGYNYGIPGQKVSPIREQVMPKRAAVSLDTSKIKVCVRKRPLLRKESAAGEKDIIWTKGQETVILRETKVAVDLTQFTHVHLYHYDEVFDDKCSNLEVYTKTAKPLVPFVLKRGKATCFSYGQTGAGKTYTMLGNKEAKGLYLLAAEDIFSMLAEETTASGLSVWVSYFEIYCGQLLDLLNDRKKLHAREDSRHNVCIAGINKIHVSGPQGLIRVVERGNRLRSTGSSGVNANSSRSHAILQIELQDSGRRKLGRFSFIDLAGSERACDTTDPNKVTRIEGAEINTSLLALKECIRALDQDHRHTPFRQSKLTQVLKDSFVGLSKTCMIANVAPGSISAQHTLNTLRYADRVKELRKNTPVHCSPSTQQQPSTRQPSTRQPSTQQPSTRQPSTRQPSTRQSSSRQPSTRQPSTRQPSTRQPSTQQPSTPHLSTPHPSTPHPSTPATFSPGNTSTPVKPAKQLLTSRQSSSKSAAIKSKTFSRSPQENAKQTNGNSKQKAFTDKTPVRKSPAPARKTTRQCVVNSKRNTNSSLSSPKSAKDSQNKHGRNASASSRTRDAVKDTPTKGSPQAKRQARRTFLLNTSLPVWEPPQEMELIQKTPEVVKRSSSLLEFDNPRYRNSLIEQISYSAQTAPPGSVSEDTQTKAENNNNSLLVMEKQKSVLHPEEQKTQDSGESIGVQTFDSFNSDSTTELLAEIDHALRHSLVSPMSDDCPLSAQNNEETSTDINQPNGRTQPDISGSGRTGRSDVNTEEVFQYPDVAQPHGSVSRLDEQVDTRLTPAKVAIKLNKTKSMSTLQHGPSLPSDTVESSGANKITMKQQISGSPGLCSRLSPQTSNSADKAKSRQNLLKDTQTRTTPEIVNTSGVIVPTSFSEYLSSHGIDIPNTIIAPDRQRDVTESTSDGLYQRYNENMSNAHAKIQHESQHSTFSKHTDSSNGDVQRKGEEDQHHCFNLSHHTSKIIQNLNPNSVFVPRFVQSNSHQNMAGNSPGQNRQHWSKSAIPVAIKSPRNIKTPSAHSSPGRQFIGNVHVTRPSPIGQNLEKHSDEAKTMLNQSIPQIQFAHAVQQTETASIQSPVTMEVLGNSAGSSFSSISDHQTFTPVASVSKPHQYSIPKAFTKESLGRSGVYLTSNSAIHSPVIKETLYNRTVPQGLPQQASPGVRRLLFHGSPKNDGASRNEPSLQLNLSGTLGLEVDDVSAILELAKAGRTSIVQKPTTAISRAKELLLSAHAEQVDEIQQLCDMEKKLIVQLKAGEKDFPEYLDHVEDLMRSKLRCIDTFRDQLDTFSHHTPVLSPRSSMEVW